MLVGGAVAAIYSNGLYRSGDLDFVKLSLFTEGLDKAMLEIGFQKMDVRRFKHPECDHILVEFPGSMTVGIGEDYDIKPKEVNFEGTIIKIYTPTDCVKDRLASYIYYKHEESLTQAVLVAQAQEISLPAVKKWCKGEGAEWAFDDLVKKLKNK